MRAPTVDEAVAIENYKTANKEALTAANAMGDKIVTAAFSFATAYGAVIALVAPKETPAAAVAAIPFVLLALAVVAGLYSQSLAISLAGTAELSALRGAVDNLVGEKRRWTRFALVALALGVFAAGWIVRDQYAEPATDETAVAVQVWLTPAGVDFANQACGVGMTAKIEGTVKDAGALSAERVGIDVPPASCASGAGTLYLDKDLIAGVRQPAAPA